MPRADRISSAAPVIAPAAEVTPTRAPVPDDAAIPPVGIAPGRAPASDAAAAPAGASANTASAFAPDPDAAPAAPPPSPPAGNVPGPPPGIGPDAPAEPDPAANKPVLRALQGPSSVEPGALAPGGPGLEAAPDDPDPFGFATPNRHGPATSAALALIRGYKRFLSPAMPPACRFVPTCSEYGYEAVARYGIIGGGRLALWRILRCNPFGRGGVDPVP